MKLTKWNSVSILILYPESKALDPITWKITPKFSLNISYNYPLLEKLFSAKLSPTVKISDVSGLPPHSGNTAAEVCKPHNGEHSLESSLFDHC